MKRRLTGKRAALLLAAAVVVIAGLWGGQHLLRRRHARAKARRVAAHRELIWKHAQANAVATELVRAVILHESGGVPAAVSPKGAKGLMQITSVTEREVLDRTGLAKGDLFDPDYNIRIGTAYLKMLMKRFDGDTHLVLAAYHAGPTRIAKLRAAHPDLDSRRLVEKHAPASTAAYCRKVIGEL